MHQTLTKEQKEALDPLFDIAFVETNPQPIKTMMAAERLCEESFRLPLTTMVESNRETVLDAWTGWKAKHGK